ncbi:MAG: T9SS type A sorting domain-containing protein [Aureispira sp.]|nr:T9SS type A sorting domain-containing protein [Aureispira sp.]
MKLSFFTIVIILTTHYIAHSQTFLKEYGNSTDIEAFTSITPTSDGNFYVGGKIGNNILLAKITPNGNLLWDKEISISAGNQHTLWNIKEDANGDVFGLGSVLVGTGKSPGFFFKFNPSSQTIVYAETTLGLVSFTGLVELPNGDYIVTGTESNASGGGCDGLMVRVDGITGNTTILQNGDIGACESYMHAKLAADGNILVTGRYTTSNGSFSINSNKMRIGLTKFTPTGEQLWSKLYLRNTTTNARLYSHKLIEEQDSIVIVGAGSLTGNGSTGHPFRGQLLKTDTAGNIAWAKQYNITSYGTHDFRTIAATTTGYLCVGMERGQTTSSFLVHTDKQGNALWCKEYNIYTDKPNSIYIDGSYIYIAGQTGNNGAFAKIEVATGILEDDASSCMADLVGDLIVSTIANPYDGNHALTELNDPQTTTNNTSTLSTNSLSTATICPFLLPIELLDFQVDKENKHQVTLNWTLNPTPDLSYFEIEHSKDGINFRTIQKVVYQAGLHSYSHQSDQYTQKDNYYRLKMVEQNTKVSYSATKHLYNSSFEATDIRIFPNPTTSYFSLYIEGIKHFKVEIYNSLGAKVWTTTIKDELSNKVHSFPIQQLPIGVYYIKVLDDTQQLGELQKLIKLGN